jgi:hypothetical protein
VDVEHAGSTTRVSLVELQQTLVEVEQAGSTTRAVRPTPAEVNEGLDRALEMVLARERGAVAGKAEEDGEAAHLERVGDGGGGGGGEVGHETDQQGGVHHGVLG